MLLLYSQPSIFGMRDKQSYDMLPLNEEQGIDVVGYTLAMA